MTDGQEQTISDGSMLYDDWKRSTFVSKIYYVWTAIFLILIVVPIGIVIFSAGKIGLNALLPCFAVGGGMGLYSDGIFIIEILLFARWIDKRKIDYIPYLKKSFSISKKNSKVVVASYIVSHPSRLKKELVFAGLFIIGFIVCTILVNYIMLDFVNKNGWPIVKVVIASIILLVTNIVPAFIYTKDNKNMLSWREHVIQDTIPSKSEKQIADQTRKLEGDGE